MIVRSAVIAYWFLGLLGLESWNALALVPSCYLCRRSYSVKCSDGGCNNCVYSPSLRNRRNLSRRTSRGYGMSEKNLLEIAVTGDGLRCEMTGCDGGVDAASLEQHSGRKRGLRKWLSRRVMEFTAIMTFAVGVHHPASVLAATTAGGDVGQLEMELCNEELLKGSEEEISELEDFLSQTDDDRLIAKYHGVNLSDRKTRPSREELKELFRARRKAKLKNAAKGVRIERGFYGSGFRRSLNDLTPATVVIPAVLAGLVALNIVSRGRAFSAEQRQRIRDESLKMKSLSEEFIDVEGEISFDEDLMMSLRKLKEERTQAGSRYASETRRFNPEFAEAHGAVDEKPNLGKSKKDGEVDDDLLGHGESKEEADKKRRNKIDELGGLFDSSPDNDDND